MIDLTKIGCKGSDGKNYEHSPKECFINPAYIVEMGVTSEGTYIIYNNQTCWIKETPKEVIEKIIDYDTLILQRAKY